MTRSRRELSLPASDPPFDILRRAQPPMHVDLAVPRLILPHAATRPPARRAPLALASIRRRIGFSDVTGEPIPPEMLRGQISVFDWRRTFTAAATIASVVANAHGGADGELARQLTVQPLVDFASHATRDTLDFAASLSRVVNDGGLIANEAAAYVIEAMALLYGAEGGPAPNSAQLAYLFLAFNDYVDEWSEESEPLTPPEELVAEGLRLGQFQRLNETKEALPRFATIMRGPPQVAPFSNSARWEAVQLSAFGESFDTYVAAFMGPLQLQSHEWGTRSSQSEPKMPLLSPSRWLAASHVGASRGADFLNGLTVDRDVACERIRATLPANGIPRSVPAFYHHPFVRLGPDTIVAASPWVVREQLRCGVWAKYRAAIKATPEGQTDREAWNRTFGGLVEGWCREVATWAADSPARRGRFILADHPGDSTEIEDVVYLDAGRVILFSVKSGFIPEPVTKHNVSRRDAVDWLDRFLFGPPIRRRRASENRRGGAFLSLDEKVRKLRAGCYRDLPAEASVAVVLVTLDGIGSIPAIDVWLQERCDALGLFGDPTVLAPTIASVGEFETLMALASNGQDIYRILERRSLERAGLGLVLEQTVPHEIQHWPELAARFDEVAQRIRRALFPHGDA